MNHPFTATATGPLSTTAVGTPNWPVFTGAATLVGTSPTGRVTVYVDQKNLGAAGVQNARDLLSDADRIVSANDEIFGTPGGPVNALIYARGGNPDGTGGRVDGLGGAEHGGCDYTSGADIEVCASFGNAARVSGLFEAELSECSMGGNLCSVSTGEALSRWCAAVISSNALADFKSAPTWAQSGMPDFVNNTENTDRNPVSVGCGMAFISWLLNQGYSLNDIAQAMVPLTSTGTLAQLYAKLTSQPAANALPTFLAAVKALPTGVTSDDPFGGMPTAAKKMQSNLIAGGLTKRSVIRSLSVSARPWALLTILFVGLLVACGAWISLSVKTAAADYIQTQWLCVEAVLLGLCVVAGYAVNNRADGILIDETNRISLARAQWVAWFIILLGGFFTESIWNIVAGFAPSVTSVTGSGAQAVTTVWHGAAFPFMQPDLYALLGIVTGSAITSSLIVDNKKAAPNAPPPPANPQIGQPTQQGLMDANVSPTEASWADLYLGEEVANRNTVDISRLQKLVITVLLVMTYVQMLWGDLGTKLAGGIKGFNEMPQVDSSFLWLLGISHAAYLAYKATPKTPASSATGTT